MVFGGRGRACVPDWGAVQTLGTKNQSVAPKKKQSVTAGGGGGSDQAHLKQRYVADQTPPIIDSLNGEGRAKGKSPNSLPTPHKAWPHFVVDRAYVS